jgi:hypothetical protein
MRPALPSALATSPATRGDLPTRIGSPPASSSPAHQAREAVPGAALEGGLVPGDQGVREGREALAKGDGGLRARCLPHRLQPEDPRREGGPGSGTPAPRSPESPPSSHRTGAFRPRRSIPCPPPRSSFSNGRLPQVVALLAAIVPPPRYERQPTSGNYVTADWSARLCWAKTRHSVGGPSPPVRGSDERENDDGSDEEHDGLLPATGTSHRRRPGPVLDTQPTPVADY